MKRQKRCTRSIRKKERNTLTGQQLACNGYQLYIWRKLHICQCLCFLLLSDIQDLPWTPSHHEPGIRYTEACMIILVSLFISHWCSSRKLRVI